MRAFCLFKMRAHPSSATASSFFQADGKSAPDWAGRSLNIFLKRCNCRWNVSFLHTFTFLYLDRDIWYVSFDMLWFIARVSSRLSRPVSEQCSYVHWTSLKRCNCIWNVSFLYTLSSQWTSLKNQPYDISEAILDIQYVASDSFQHASEMWCVLSALLMSKSPDERPNF